jgi:cellulose synthase/poly-beta-1,6-N-acetylglucosamine synthase-like glycosyltransferase
MTDTQIHPDVRTLARARVHHVPVRTAAPRVSVVIPTYNEARNLPRVFSRLPAGLHEVVVVDGRSVDDTIEVARALGPTSESSGGTAVARATPWPAGSRP